jgi:predicted oxidoreductase
MSDDVSSVQLGGSRRLGGSELEVGPIAYGCWRFAGQEPAAAHELIDAALDRGFTLIDTADIYGFDGTDGFGDAEELLGRVLAATPGLRDRMVLATKGGIRPGVPYDWSAAYLRRACEDSLRRLGVDVIDLYQLHRPDVLTHPDEVAEVLADLVARGWVRQVGLSNVTPSQFALVQSRTELPLVTTQPEFSVWHSDPVRDGTFDQCLERGVTPLAWSPLGGGRIAVADDPVTLALERIAARHDVDASTVALAFVMTHPSRPVPILGTQRVERVHTAAAALELRLERTEWYELYQAGTGEPLP